MPQVLRMWSLGAGLQAYASPVFRICTLPSQMVPAPACAPFRFRASLQGLLHPTGAVPAVPKMPNNVPKALKWRGVIYSGFDSIFS